MENRRDPAARKALIHKTCVFMIHVLTASGAACALMAMIAAANDMWQTMFMWLGLALTLDGIDGPLARKTKISKVLPRWSGETLDLVVDFVTYVFVPAYAIAVGGFLPGAWGIFAGLAIVVTSAIYFADNNMKTEDNYFRGFPAIWNIAAFYLFLMTPAPWIATLFVAALVVLTFLPVPFIHPVRVRRFRKLNIALLIVWSLLATAAILNNMSAGWPVTAALSVLGIYILGGGFLRGMKQAAAERQ